MRFLTGLLAGGALVLLLMQSVALRPGPLLSETQRIWGAFETGVLRGWAPVRDGSPQAAVEPEPESEPEPEPSLPPVAAPATSAAPRVPLQDRTAPEPPPAVEERGTQTVWAPFHSQRSAEGFAQGLTDALSRPFEVRREGPGHYAVLFTYDDERDRREVLQAMTEHAGAAL